jgi:hypothetical protein
VARCWRCRAPPGSSGGPSRRVRRARSSRPSSPPTSPRPAPLSWACGRRRRNWRRSTRPALCRRRRDRRHDGSPVGRWGQVAYRSIPFSPVVDGDSLPVTPWRALADGAGRGVELLVGHTRDEQRLFTALAGMLGEVTDEQAAAALDVLAPGPDGARRYRGGFPAAGPDELYELVNSDWAFRMPTLRLAEAQAGAGGRAHVLRAHLASTGNGRDPRGVSWPRRAAGLRQPGPRPARRADRREPERGSGGAVRPHALRVDGVRHRRQPGLDPVRRRATARAALRHEPNGDRRSRGDVTSGSGRTTSFGRCH